MQREAVGPGRKSSAEAVSVQGTCARDLQDAVMLSSARLASQQGREREGGRKQKHRVGNIFKTKKGNRTEATVIWFLLLFFWVRIT